MVLEIEEIKSALNDGKCTEKFAQEIVILESI